MMLIHDWNQLSDAQRNAVLQRPVPRDATIEATVIAIIEEVRLRGDAALADYTRRFDGISLASLRVEDKEFRRAGAALSATARAAIDVAIANVRRFHEAQRPAPVGVDIAPGVRCERVAVPIQSVGLYVPAGSAPLPSAAIMTAVPAAIAGCPQRVLCTAPQADGYADPAVLVAAQQCGVTDVFKVGGAQAIAALAYGTSTIPKVDKIFGPGNAYVTAAKQAVARDPGGAALDLPAGPSEVLVIADQTANPRYVAADLLAQAEHDPSAHVVLVTTSREVAERTIREVTLQQARLTRKAITSISLSDAAIILVPDLPTAFEVSNRYAPEHLILAIDAPRQWIGRVTAAGSVFLGHWTPETIGDYCSGANHVLPTAGFARAYSGLSVADFVRHITLQELTPAGLRHLGPTAVALANLEGLDAHAHAVTVRLDDLAPH